MNDSVFLGAPSAPAGFTDGELVMVREMEAQIVRASQKNLLLDVYYDGHRSFQDLGISVPPQMKQVRAALGWPEKAVSALARKHVFEGYAVAGESDPYGIGKVLRRNRFELKLPQAINSAYKHAVAFLAVTPGEEGEAPLVHAYDAKNATVLFDERTGDVKAAMVVARASASDDVRDLPGMHVLEATFYFPDRNLEVRREKGSSAWSVQVLANATGRVLVEPLVNDPQLDRPFGHSRITREVRYLTDAAVRTLVRAETGAEFFASPQRYLMGADESAFADGKWKAITGRVWAIGKDEDGDLPQPGEFSQHSMEPHLSMYRQLAQNFCAATNLPMSTVGIFADNPSSYEAMQAAEYALSDEAERQWRVFEDPLRRILQDVVMLERGLAEPPDDSWDIDIRWTPARYVSPQAASDYIVKVASVFEDIKGTDVAKRRAGFTQAEIDEMNAQGRRANALAMLDRLAAGLSPEADDAAEPEPPAFAGVDGEK